MEQLIKEIIDWAPDLFDFMAIVSILLYKKMEVKCFQCVIVQNLKAIILDIEHSNRKVNIILVTTSNIWKIRLELKVVIDWQK